MRCGRVLLHQQRGVARNPRAVVAGGPRDQDLRLGEQQRAVAVGLQLQPLDLAMQPRFALRGADAGVHQQDRGQHGKAEQGERRGQHRDFLPVEVEQGRDRVEEAANRRPRRASRRAARSRRNRSGRCVPAKCTTAASDASIRLRPTSFAPQGQTSIGARHFPHRARIKRQYRQGDSRGKSPDRERGSGWGKKRTGARPKAIGRTLRRDPAPIN